MKTTRPTRFFWDGSETLFGFPLPTRQALTTTHGAGEGKKHAVRIEAPKIAVKRARGELDVHIFSARRHAIEIARHDSAQQILVRASRHDDRIVNVRVGGNAVEVMRGEVFF